MTRSGQLLARIEASEALTRLQKAAETGDWAELKPEESQEAAALLVESAARIRDLEAQLAAQAEALVKVREVATERTAYWQDSATRASREVNGEGDAHRNGYQIGRADMLGAIAADWNDVARTLGAQS